MLTVQCMHAARCVSLTLLVLYSTVGPTDTW